MKILFDQGTPVPLRAFLNAHEVSTAFELGWNQLTNGDLIKKAKAEKFDLLITTDQNLKYQQDLDSRSIGILVLSTTRWPWIREAKDLIVHQVDRFEPSAYLELSIPDPR